MTMNRQAFLSMLAWSEGTSTSPATVCSGYDVIVTGMDGRPEVFTSFTSHPFANGRPPKRINARGLCSSASGRYQLLLRYWQAYSKLLGLRDFTAPSQDAIAIQQIKERGALDAIDRGHITTAIGSVSPLWASLPGTGYEGQGQRHMPELIAAYVKAGGTLANP